MSRSTPQRPRVIGVLDVQHGLAVHAVAGRRDAYQPLRHVDGSVCSPGDRARQLATMGVRELYLADLDAIERHTSLTEAWAVVAEQVDTLWLDVAIGDCRQARLVCEFAAQLPTNVIPIIGLESLSATEQLPDIVNMLGGDAVAFSLDLRGGQPITELAAWRSSNSMEIIDDVLRTGVRRLIVLDLTAVGRLDGCSTLDVCREIRSRYGHLELVTGGGIRNTTDLARVQQAGCDAALVGTAIADIVQTNVNP